MNCGVCDEPARFALIDMTETEPEPHALCVKCLYRFIMALIAVSN